MTPSLSWLDSFFGSAVVKLASVFFPKRPVLEFAEGDGVELLIEDVPANKSTRVTISATGGGSEPVPDPVAVDSWTLQSEDGNSFYKKTLTRFSTTGAGNFLAVDFELDPNSTAQVEVRVQGQANGKSYSSFLDAHYNRDGTSDVTFLTGANSASGIGSPLASGAFVEDSGESVQYELGPGETLDYDWTVTVEMWVSRKAAE